MNRMNGHRNVLLVITINKETISVYREAIASRVGFIIGIFFCVML